MTTADDSTLYERWLESRDGDAFAELARRHSGVVYDLAVRYSGDAVLAEDLVQEALLDLALAGSRKPIEVGFVAWLARFAMCRARNVRASERARRRRQQTVGERRREDVMPDDRVEREDELQRALARAEPDERIVLAMRYLHGWEYARIASALAISEGAARVRVHRALGALRSRLGVDAPDAATVAAGDGSNGRLAAMGAPLLGLLGQMPVHRMPDGLLEMSVRNAIDAAANAAGAGAGAALVPRVGRLTLQALGLTALLGAATAVSLTAGPRALTSGGVAQREASVASATGGGAGASRGATGAYLASGAGGVPRPPQWDDGVLRRMRPEVGTTPPDDVAEPTAPAAAPAARAPEIRPLPSDRPVEVLRPTSRDARAATRDPVSSEDERAGIPAGRGVRVRAPSDVAPPPPAERAPGLPAELDAPDPARGAGSVRIADRPSLALQDLPPEQADLVHEAAALVARVVAADGAAFDGVVADRRYLRRQSKALRKEYRRARRGLRRAAVEDNAAAWAQETARAAQVSTAQHVLKLLLGIVLADGTAASELRWPEGADVTAALRDVVTTLGTLLPDGAASDDAAAPGPAGDEILPDGFAPAETLPDGAAR